MENTSHVNMFTLSELKESKAYKCVYFTVFLIVYLLIIFLNCFLIVVILIEKALHEPMFIFLCNLFMNALFGTAGFYPKFLSDLHSGSSVITYKGCFMQAFVIYTSALSEFTTLTVMAYDRYVAICRPLDYYSVMTNKNIVKLSLFAFILPALSMAGGLLLSNALPLCGSHIDKLYCDICTIVKLSCVPATVNNIYGFVNMVIYLSLVLFIIYTYCNLIAACIKSTECTNKFIYTCLPHLFSLINFTAAVLFDTMYNRYGSNRDLPQSLQCFLALVILTFSPICNPLIYGLKLTEIRKRTFAVFIKFIVIDCNVKKR